MKSFYKYLHWNRKNIEKKDFFQCVSTVLGFSMSINDKVNKMCDFSAQRERHQT